MTLSTLILYKRPCQGCVQTDVLSMNHKTKTAVLFRLLTQNKDAPKKRNNDCQSDRHVKKKKWKRMIVSKIEIKLQFSYMVQAQFEHHTAADTHLQYDCA